MINNDIEERDSRIDEQIRYDEGNIIVADNGDYITQRDLPTHNDVKVSNQSLDRNKKSVKASFLKVVSTFIVACAITASVQTTIKIPVFSDIFNPIGNAIAVEQNVDVGDKTIKVAYSDVITTQEYMKVNVKIDNCDDLDSNKYYAILVENGNDNIEDINQIPKADIDANKIIFTSSSMSVTFEKYVGKFKGGPRKIDKNHNYVMVVLKDKTILNKLSLTSQNMSNIGVNIMVKSTYVELHFTLDSELNSKCWYLYSLFTDNKGNVVTFANTINDGSYANILRTEFGTNQLKYRLYCLPYPAMEESFNNIPSIVPFSGDPSLVYYLIYSDDINLTDYIV